MAPCPKRRHSHKRGGKREYAKRKSLPQLVVDKETGKRRLSHQSERDTI